MSTNISQSEIQAIVSKVLQNIEQHTKAGKQTSTSATPQSASHPTPSAATSIQSSVQAGEYGVYTTMEEAIQAARFAYDQVRHLSIEERETMISAIREIARNEAEKMAEMGFVETKMGNVPDKIIKHLSVANLTPGTEDLQPEVYTGTNGVTMIEHTAFGIIGAITPSTNSSETIICNAIGMLAAGNVVVFNPHPGAKVTSAYAVKKVNEAVRQSGFSMDIAFTVAEPTMETSKVLFSHPEVKLLVGTGGPALTEAILKSGKKAICAGAGNPPVIVDETADLAAAAKHIVAGATLDNNMPCIAEKECIVLDDCADDLIYHFMQNGVYMASKEEIDKLYCTVFTEIKAQQAWGCVLGKTSQQVAVNKAWIGQDAQKLLEAIGVTGRPDVKLIVCEVDESHPFVMKELMMPILPLVRVKSFDEAVRIAVKAEGGNRHSAFIHSNHLQRITQFARTIQTTIFVANGPSFAGIGIQGEGFCSFTIAGGTGEGITSPRSFSRKRRLVLSGGSLNIK